MTYDAKCWQLKKQQVKEVYAAEMRMLRWAGCVAVLDHNLWYFQSKTYPKETSGK